jgi:uncharacterized coiled-coil protein SlyX
MPDGDAHHDRLTRVEESVGFVERATDQLSGEIAELNRRIAEAARRLDALERRVRALAADAPDEDRAEDDGAH